MESALDSGVAAERGLIIPSMSLTRRGLWSPCQRVRLRTLGVARLGYGDEYLDVRAGGRELECFGDLLEGSGGGDEVDRADGAVL